MTVVEMRLRRTLWHRRRHLSSWLMLYVFMAAVFLAVAVAFSYGGAPDCRSRRIVR